MGNTSIAIEIWKQQAYTHSWQNNNCILQTIAFWDKLRLKKKKLFILPKIVVHLEEWIGMFSNDDVWWNI